ncbi:solute carrier family 2, facilitated glucose transporter member 1 isoform 2-T2 [Spinachia spinachia]
MASQESRLTGTLLTSILAAVLGSLQIGYHTGNVNAPAKIIEEFFNHTWRVRHNQTMPDHSLTLLLSLSVSIKDFGALLGSLGVKYLADSHGRRNSILIVNCLSVVGACLMSASKASQSFEVLILGRVVFGLFCGLVMSLNPLYIQEVSPTHLRGAFATLNQVFFATGILLGMVAGLETVLGTEHHWAMMLSLSIIPALMQYLVLPFCPESPRYLLISRGEESKAEAALMRLRGSAEKVFAELEEMKEEAAHTQSGVTIHEFFKKRRYKKPIIIVLVINLGSQLSGFNAIINYSTRMFQAKFDQAKYLTLGVGAVNVTFTLVAFFLMERAGRRRLLLTGFISIAVCNLLMTIVDSVLVRHFTFHLHYTPNILPYLFWHAHFNPNKPQIFTIVNNAAPGPGVAEPAGPASFLPDFCLRAGPRPHLVVHRRRAVRPAGSPHRHGLHQHAQLGREVCSGTPLSSFTGGFTVSAQLNGEGGFLACFRKFLQTLETLLLNTSYKSVI